MRVTSSNKHDAANEPYICCGGKKRHKIKTMPGRSKIMQTSRRPTKKKSWETRTIDETVEAPSRNEDKSLQNLIGKDDRESIIPSEKPSTPPKKQGAGTWLSGFNALFAYKEKHGNLDVKSSDADMYLSNWVRDQRHDQGKLTQEQRRQLEDIGFDFTLENNVHQGWGYRLSLLKEYKKKYKTCLMPNRYDVGRTDLGRWVAKQRGTRAARLEHEKRGS